LFFKHIIVAYIFSTEKAFLQVWLKEILKFSLLYFRLACVKKACKLHIVLLKMNVIFTLTSV